MTSTDPIQDRVLERQGRRMTQPGLRLLVIGLIVAIPGIVLIVVGSQGLLGFGIALLLIASVPGALGLGLIFSGTVARWAARHRLFA